MKKKMKTIWKFKLDVVDEQTIEVPKGAVPLCVQIQKCFNIPFIWVLVNPAETEKENIEIITKGTGHVFDDERCKYIGTYQTLNGNLIFHVFKKE